MYTYCFAILHQLPAAQTSEFGFEIFSSKVIEEGIKAAVHVSEAESDHQGLVQAGLAAAAVHQVGSSQDVVRQETDEGEDETDGNGQQRLPVTDCPLALSSPGLEQRSDSKDVAEYNCAERQNEAHNKDKAVHHEEPVCAGGVEVQAFDWVVVASDSLV